MTLTADGLFGDVDGLARTVADLIGVGVPTATPEGRGGEDGGGPTVRAGIDLTSVPEVAHSLDRFGDRFLRRIFTSHERGCCRSGGGTGRGTDGAGYSVESLAARFAAKEAVIKVLRPVGPRPPWLDIEVHRAAAGWCEIRLSGAAQILADRAGIDQWSVSMTHHGAMAAAVVIGVHRPASDPNAALGARISTEGDRPGGRSDGRREHG